MDFAGFPANYAASAAPGKGQDRYLIRSDFIGVADGATPLDSSWPSDSGAFSEFALNELAGASEMAEMEIVSVWRQAISKTAQHFSVIEPQLSCGVAIARRSGDTIETSTLGDCGAIILDRRGSIISIRDNRLSELDHEVDLASGEDAQRKKLANRDSLNSPGGYWAFSANTDAADHILTSRIRLQDLECLILYTDGFYRIRDPYDKVQNDRQLLKLVRDLGAAGSIEWLRKYENSLPTGPTRPFDDATLVICGE